MKRDKNNCAYRAILINFVARVIGWSKCKHLGSKIDSLYNFQWNLQYRYTTERNSIPVEDL